MSLVVRLVLSVVLALTLAVMQATGSDAAFSWITGPTIPEVEVNRAAHWRSTTVRNATDVDLVMRYSSTAGTPADTWQQLKVQRNGQRIFTGGAVGSTLVEPRKLTAAASGARVGRATLGATRLAGGPIMIAWLGGDLLWTGYRHLNPPPDWDWETGDDPEVGVEQAFAAQLLDRVSVGGTELWPSGSWSTYPFDGEVQLDVGPDGYRMTGWTYYRGTTPNRMGWQIWSPTDGLQHNRPVGTFTPEQVQYSEHDVGGLTHRIEWSIDWDLVGVAPDSEVVYTQHANQSMGSSAYRTHRYGDPFSAVETADGRVVYELECTPDAGGTVLDLKVESDWYSTHSDRPDLAPYECPSGYELTDICVYRELSTGGQRAIIGCGADGQGGVGLSLDGGSTTASIVTAPSPSRPSEWPTELEQPGADDLYDDLERSDGRLVLVDLVQGLEATPSTHQGWWTYPDAQTRFECRWYGLSSGEYVVLDLERCSEMRWEDGIGLFPETPITEGTPSTTIELDAPEQTDEPTVTPTPDGQPLTSPDPDVDCMSDYPEDTGFVGRVIFRSVACVVLWAFTPSPDTFTSWQQDVTTQVSTRAPVAYLAPGADFMTAIGEGAQQCFEWAAPISLNMFGPAVDASTSEPVPILSTCNPGPLESRMIELRPLFVVLMFSMFFVPLAWWGWRSYAPGTTSSA